jgi:hypothetical protein
VISQEYAGIYLAMPNFILQDAEPISGILNRPCYHPLTIWSGKRNCRYGFSPQQLKLAERGRINRIAKQFERCCGLKSALRSMPTVSAMQLETWKIRLTVPKIVSERRSRRFNVLT